MDGASVLLSKEQIGIAASRTMLAFGIPCVRARESAPSLVCLQAIPNVHASPRRRALAETAVPENARGLPTGKQERQKAQRRIQRRHSKPCAGAKVPNVRSTPQEKRQPRSAQGLQCDASTTFHAHARACGKYGQLLKASNFGIPCEINGPCEGPLSVLSFLFFSPFSQSVLPAIRPQAETACAAGKVAGEKGVRSDIPRQEEAPIQPWGDQKRKTQGKNFRVIDGRTCDKFLTSESPTALKFAYGGGPFAIPCASIGYDSSQTLPAAYVQEG